MAKAPALQQPRGLLRALPDLRLLFVLAWPIVLARAAQAIGGFADALMIAPLGEAALAAVTTGWLDMYIASILPVSTVYILQSYTAQLRGRGDLASVRRYAWYGLGIAGAAQLVVLACIPLLPSLLAAAPFEPQVRADLVVYLSIRLLTIGSLVATEALGSWYGGLGDTRPALRAGLVTLAASVLGNSLLIPAHGVAGAAWASVIGSLCGLAVIAVPFARSAAPGPARLGLSARELGRVLRLGLPHGISWFLEVAAFIFFVNVVVAHLGTTALAAFNVVTQLNAIAYLPTLGLALAGAIAAGEAIGRGALPAAVRVAGLAVGAAVVWMVSMAALYLALPAPLVEAFAYSPDAALGFVAVGVVILRFYALTQVFDAIGTVLNQVLRAAGDTTWCMLARGLVSWLVFAPVAWYVVIEADGGVNSAMLVFLAYIAAMALVVAVRFRSSRWQAMDLVGQDTRVA